ncbi:septin 7-like protein pnut isoform X3 [Dermatophagoides farinae]|uniref:septin 7-like protein pnut isoform X3 n=1 Tax=Dermatophagoides farinae TaxID=6954 RepID=UPI001F0F29E0|nr:septin-7-like isoform X3 [Dermatophagoides farinae]
MMNVFRSTPSKPVRPKELSGSSSSGGGPKTATNFQSLMAGWENNTSIGKGIQSSTTVSYPVVAKNIVDDSHQQSSVASNTLITITTTHNGQKSVPNSPMIDSIPTRPNSIFSTSHYRSSSNLYSPPPSTSSVTNQPMSYTFSTYQPSTSSSISVRNASLREQFMTNGNVTSIQATTPTSSYNYLSVPSGQYRPYSQQLNDHDHQQPIITQHHEDDSSRMATTPSYGGGYRFAGVERLAQRGNVYGTSIMNPSSSLSRGKSRHDLCDDEVNNLSKNDALNSKREYYFRDSSSPTSTISNGTKDYTRDRLESMGFSSRNTDDLKSSGLTKDGEHFVGFSHLPNQIHRKTIKKGFEFTLMVVGESGLGKSTLVNSMFLTDIYSPEYPGPSKRAAKTVEVEQTRVSLKEKSVNLYLSIVDTPGYGTAVDNTNCWQPIVNFIESRYEEYLNAETRVHRTHIQDSRVHCCLYFIAPSGHSLKPIDIQFMLHLHDKVNIIPVIAKADAFTPEELSAFKKNIMNEINQNKIKIYDFPDPEDEEESKLLKSFKSRVPFAVVGSNYVLEVAGERKRGRKYPWGLVEIESLEHCDFHALRNLLIRHYMLDLIETTNNVHYENYRCRKLTGISPEMALKGKDNNVCDHGNNRNSKSTMVFWNPLAQMEEEKKEHDVKMKRMEIEMEQVFEQKVKEKLHKLKETEEEYMRRHEEMAKKLEQQRQEVDERRAAFEKEKAAFELVSKDMEEIRRVNTLDLNMKDLQLDGSKNKEKKKKGLF